VRVIFVQGTEDGTVPYAGGTFLGGRVLGAEDTVGRWRTAGNCTDTTTAKGSFDFDLLVAGDETTVTVWEECTGGSVELWRMEGSGHVPGLLPAFRSALMRSLLGLEE
jgi:poly(3-hydroxybutyrate) depolymerase